MASYGSRSKGSIEKFDLAPGTEIAGKYVVICLLGSGWEGEVYKVHERNTGIERAAKLFYPQRNVGGKTAASYARRLHKLRECPVLIQYHTEERLDFDGIPVTVLISEYIEGQLLKEFLKRQPGKRLGVFQAVHLLYALTLGIESIHLRGEYHGDLHPENVIISRHGLSFDLKFLDLFEWKFSRKENMQEDVFDVIRIFYDALGGRKHYANQPPEVKAICSGLKRSLIRRKFRSASVLRAYLENMQWS